MTFSLETVRKRHQDPYPHRRGKLIPNAAFRLQRCLAGRPSPVRSVLVGSLLLCFAGLGSVLIWKTSQTSARGGRRWLVEASKLDRPQPATELAAGLAELGVFMEAADREEHARSRQVFLEPLKNFLRKEAQFPQLRLAESSGCVLVSLTCQNHKGMRSDHFGEALYRDKYEIALAAYVALGSAIAIFRTQHEASAALEPGDAASGVVTSDLLKQCQIARERGVLALDRSQCQGSAGGDPTVGGRSAPGTSLDEREARAALSLRL